MRFWQKVMRHGSVSVEDYPSCMSLTLNFCRSCWLLMMRCFPAIEQTLTMRPPELISGAIASHTCWVPTKFVSRVCLASAGPKVLPLKAMPATALSLPRTSIKSINSVGIKGSIPSFLLLCMCICQLELGRVRGSYIRGRPFNVADDITSIVDENCHIFVLVFHTLCKVLDRCLIRNIQLLKVDLRRSCRQYAASRSKQDILPSACAFRVYVQF